MPTASTPDLGDAQTAERFFRVAERARAADGQPPFSDQSLVDLRTGSRRPLMIDDIAAAIVSETEAEFVVAPDARGRGTGTALLGAIIAGTSGSLLVWAHGDHPAARALAASHGLVAVRELLQLRGPVTATAAETFDTFRPGEDDAEWLALNARAFVHHPEQGSVGQSDLDELMAEPWFDAADFIVARENGAMVGYCWLKIEGELGEFYVVGVDPGRQGAGLGRRLMEAGFARLAGHGTRTAHLYVEADNLAAVHLYRSFGFTDHSIDIQYQLRRG